MATCSYCGQSAGLLRKWHQECHDRHERALQTIPGFFPKILDSAVLPERFADLLRSAADACFVTSDELKTLCQAGISSVVDSILRERPLTVSEAQRIMEFTDALELIMPDGLGLDEKLTKAAIIAELRDDRTPNHVSVVGPMPIEFGRNESVIWIFNQATAYRAPVIEAEHSSLPVFASADIPYMTPQAVAEIAPPAGRLGREMKGDLVLTNRAIHFLRSENASLRIPIARVVSLQVNREGVHVACAVAKQSRLFLVDDPWFAGNVIGQLLGQMRQTMQVREALPAATDEGPAPA